MDNLIYIVKDFRGQTQAIFLRRWQAEKFAEEYDFIVKVLREEEIEE